MGYRNTVETKVADFVVGRYVVFPTTYSGTWNGILVRISPRLGQYAEPGSVNLTVRDDSDGEEYTLVSSANYSGYMSEDEAPQDEEEAPEPKRYVFEVQVPVKGEVIFRIEAETQDEAIDLATQVDWSDGELNIDHDYSASSHVVVLEEL